VKGKSFVVGRKRKEKIIIVLELLSLCFSIPISERKNGKEACKGKLIQRHGMSVVWMNLW
jgi:hypothetical protein